MAGTRLYLLVEEASQEFASRLLVASVSLEHGFDVIVAPQWVVWANLGNLQPGIIVFKGTNRAQSLRMRRAKALGFLIAAMDEEAFGISDGKVITRMWDPATANFCDILLAQGQFHRDPLIEQHPGLAEFIRVTGNPRSDVLGLLFSGLIRDQANELRETWGDFVLFNCNFGAINPRNGDAVSFFEIVERMGIIDSSRRDDIDHHLDRLKWETNNLGAMLSVLQKLVSKGFPWRIVVRPHPAENIDHWKCGLDDVPGVEVIRDGDHRAWSLAARLLVHSSSTTGLETYLLGGRVMSLCTADSPWNGVYTSNLVNDVYLGTDSAVATIFDVVDEPPVDLEKQSRFARNLARHLRGAPDDMAADHVVDALVDLRNRKGSDLAKESAREVIGFVPVSDAKVDPVLFDPVSAGEALADMRSILSFDTPIKVELLGPWMLRFQQAVEAPS